MRVQMISAGLALVALSGAQALGAYNISAGTSAPTYSTTLNFDEPGAPTGVGLPTNSWTSYGVTSLAAGDSIQVVDTFNTSPGFGWLGTGNAFYGNFGVFMNFDSDLDAFSAQIWDPSGPPSPFGGGAGVFIFDDGVEVGSFFYTPAWGGVGDEWLHITADSGMAFDEVRVLGFGFGPTTYMDNASWNAIPAPGAAACLGLAGAVFSRRRRTTLA